MPSPSHGAVVKVTERMKGIGFVPLEIIRLGLGVPLSGRTTGMCKVVGSISRTKKQKNPDLPPQLE
jgi:hypothetical protein